ncbi:hypothetical protein HDA40_006856 [Hamadaea flava]|uniref:Uncharacterized protein n=1 Tax=Hamadaea flava TaxID=1742688 RepID=A0ABV8LS19_9ACTN|nr:hypothetical protein [Hamadaea flava]MCP2328349.1 hypothetical protein [Hamadaea flava]
MTGAELNEPCATCGESMAGYVSEAIAGHRLVWAVSMRCDGCGAALEIDDSGEMPAPVRAALVARVGLVRLHVEPESARGLRVPLLAVFRKQGMTYSEAIAAYNDIIAGGVAGTPAEMKLLAGLVNATGATPVLRVVV